MALSPQPVESEFYGIVGYAQCGPRVYGSELIMPAGSQLLNKFPG